MLRASACGFATMIATSRMPSGAWVRQSSSESIYRPWFREVSGGARGWSERAADLAARPSRSGTPWTP